MLPIIVLVVSSFATLLSVGSDRRIREASTLKIVYVSHPLACNPARNVKRVRRIVQEIAAARDLPIAPHLYLTQFLSEESGRDLAIEMCLRLVGLADELRVYGEPSHGMQLEIAEATVRGIPIVHVESE